mmetsp:Transcript_66708/g.193181  ORF Transcript_66708/g.193181 Transcript_66708/m.193181 type:complete len:220 (-) Transcript_66708:937-1596(-)
MASRRRVAPGHLAAGAVVALLAGGGALAASAPLAVQPASLVRRESAMAQEQADEARPRLPWPAATGAMPPLCANNVVAETCALLRKSTAPEGTIKAGDLRVALGCSNDRDIYDLLKKVLGRAASMNEEVRCKDLCSGAASYLKQNAKQYVMPGHSDTTCYEGQGRKWKCDLEVSPPTVMALMTGPDASASSKGSATPSLAPGRSRLGSGDRGVRGCVRR